MATIGATARILARLTAVAVIVGLGVVTGAQSPAQTPPVFRGGTNFVLVDAYPQRAGKIVEGLTAADFTVLEDGKPQKVETIEFVRVEAGHPESSRRDPNTIEEMMALAADPHARVFVVYLDTSHTTVDDAQRMRQPLISALNRIIGPDDLFGVITPRQRASDLTLGRRMLTTEEQLTRHWAWGERDRQGTDPSDPIEGDLSSCFHQRLAGSQFVPWLVSDGPVQRYLDDILIERRREDRLLTSLDDLVTHLTGLREARTVMMVVTDGWVIFEPNRALESEPMRDDRGKAGPLSTLGAPGAFAGGQAPLGGRDVTFVQCVGQLNHLAGLENAKRLRDLIARANRANVSFYPISPRGLAVFDTAMTAQPTLLNPNNPASGQTVLGRDRSRLTGRLSSLRTIAEATDGIAVVNENDLNVGLARIVDDVSAYYLLGYYSTNTKFDGKVRLIDVRMQPPGLTVHARRGYLAPNDNARAASPVATGAASAPAGPSAVDEAIALLGRSRASADFYTAGAAVGTDLAVVVEISSAQVDAGSWSKGATVSVDVRTTSGSAVGTGSGSIDAGARGTVVRVPIGTSVGPWRVTARATGGAAPLDARLEVGAPTGTLLGDALMFRATPSPRSVLRAVADFQFRRTERLHVEWPVIRPIDQRTARVLDRRGQPLRLGATLTELPSAGGPAKVAVDVNLAPFAEGDYVVEVAAGAGAQHERKLVAFRVVR